MINPSLPAAEGGGPRLRQRSTKRRDTIGAAQACLELLRNFIAGNNDGIVKRREGQLLAALTKGQWAALGFGNRVAVEELWGVAQWVTAGDARRWLASSGVGPNCKDVLRIGVEFKRVPWRGDMFCLRFSDLLRLAKYRKVRQLAHDVGLSRRIEPLWVLLENEGPRSVALLAASLWRHTLQTTGSHAIIPELHKHGPRHQHPQGYPARCASIVRRGLRKRNEQLGDQALTDEEIEERVMEHVIHKYYPEEVEVPDLDEELPQ